MNRGMIRKNSAKNRKVVKENKIQGLLVYGVGKHLADMLNWHPELKDRIERIFDKDEKKKGRPAIGIGKLVEEPTELKLLPEGTIISISAIRYYDEISEEIKSINPGLICENIDDTYVKLPPLPSASGMLIYGVGNHLSDMLNWHPDLADRVVRVFDKDADKIGHPVPGIGIYIESLENLKNLPYGTRITIAAIRWYDEIKEEIKAINPGLICEHIDIAYARKTIELSKRNNSNNQVVLPPPIVKAKYGLTDLQSQRIRGRELQARWRQSFLLSCINCRHIFWGAYGVRSIYLSRLFAPLMRDGDIYIEDSPRMHGCLRNGLPVCTPDVLKNMRGKFVIIVLSEEYSKVREMLRDFGYTENVDFVEGRQLLSEDENGYINIPCIDKTKTGMIIYGYGAHLIDMLNWHPEIKKNVSRIIDKDIKKIGTIVSGIGVRIEPPEVMGKLPGGTEIAVSAIRYFDEIEREIHAIQPDLICKNMDNIWHEYV